MSSTLTSSVEIRIQLNRGAAGERDPSPSSIARVLLLASLMGAPWAFGGVITWAWIALGLVASTALFLWAAGNVQQGTLKLIWSPLYVPLLMFFLYGFLQYRFKLTLDASETREALVLLAADVIFFFLSIQLFSTASRAAWRWFGLAVLVFAGSLGLFTILQLASGGHEIYGSVETPGNLHFGPYVNPNHYAGLMEMLIPVALLYIAERNRKYSLGIFTLLVLAATLGVASLLLSGSKGGWLALSVETVIVAAMIRRYARSGKAGNIAIAAAATILIAVLLFSWVDSGWVSKRLGWTANGAENAWAEWSDFRKTLVLDTLRMWRAHPVLGVGLGTFEIAYPGYQSFPSELWIENAHNDYVEAAAETGLVGAVLILSALALFLPLAFRDLPRRLGSEGAWIRLGAAIGCCGLLVHSFFDFNLHLPANAVWFAVLAGMAVATSNRKHSDIKLSEAV
jgi:O-antigen ligase